MQKCVAITGASSGIGRACALEFARNGYDLALGSRRTHKLKELAAEIKAFSSVKVLAIELDVQNPQSIKHYGEQVLNEYGCPQVLVNNAGMADGVAQLKDVSDSQLNQMITTNLTGMLQISRYFVNKMLLTPNESRTIIHMGSIAGHSGYSGGSIYCATKFAVRGLSQALRQELLGTAVKLTHICPGMVETEFSLVRLGDLEKAQKVYAGMQPLRPEDVAAVVFFTSTRPAHVSIDELILMPQDQASVFHVNRRQ